MIKSFLINYFGFNRQQRNGLFILMVAIFVLFVVRLTFPYFIKPDNIVIKNLQLATIAEDSIDAGNPTKNVDRKSSTLFNFDPNKVTEQELVQLGFSEKQASSFVRYRSKGIVFRQKEDLKKVFVVSDKMYEKLSPYVHILPVQVTDPVLSEPATSQLPATPAPITRSIEKLELNSADSIALLSLPGVGPAYAKRILKYRSLLGGFSSTEQLSEVYGFPPDLHEKLKDKVSVNTADVKKIDLNKDDFKTITRHPYIGYERTKTIFDFRKRNEITGSNLAELFPSETDRAKVLPYLILR